MKFYFILFFVASLFLNILSLFFSLMMFSLFLLSFLSSSWVFLDLNL